MLQLPISGSSIRCQNRAVQEKMPSVCQHIVYPPTDVLVFCQSLPCYSRLIRQCRGIKAKSTLHASKREEIEGYCNSEDSHHWTEADPEVRVKTKATPASNFVSNKMKGVKECIK